MSTTGYTKEDQTLILAHIIWSDKLIALCSGVVTTDDFDLNIHRLVWEVAEAFYLNHKEKAAPALLMNKIIRATKGLDTCVTFVGENEHDALASLWSTLMDIRNTGLNENYYRNEIPAYLKATRKRKLVETSVDNYDDLAVDLTKVHNEIEDWDRPAEAAHNVLSYEKCGLILGEEEYVTIPTGLRLLDRALSGGTAEGELGLVFAPTGVGKTNTLLNMAVYNASIGNKSLFISLELAVDSRGKNVKARTLAMQGCVPAKLTLKHIRTWPANAQLKAKAILDPSYYAYGLIQFREEHTKTINTDEIEKLIIDWKKAEGIKACAPVYIDWQKYIKPSPSLGITNRNSAWEEIVAVNEELGKIAKRHKVTIWTATQADEKCKNKPILHKGDVSFAKHIHDSVDISFGLNRSAECLLQEEDIGQELDKDITLNCNITKNRNGQECLFEIFQAPTLRFYEKKEDYLRISRVLDRLDDTDMIFKFLNASGKTAKPTPLMNVEGVL